MKVGIISDTHDHLIKIREAVHILNEHSVELVLHAGDFVAPFSLNPLLEELKCPWYGVFGNNDGERKGLATKSQGRITNPPYFIDISGKKVGLTHEFKDLDAEVIIYGHTHTPQIEEKDGKLLINPGEVCGWLSMKSSLVIIDFDVLRPEIIYF